jgi:hypothetical protein
LTPVLNDEGKIGRFFITSVAVLEEAELLCTVSDKKKAPWQKNGLVFQRFLAVLYSVAFDV